MSAPIVAGIMCLPEVSRLRQVAPASALQPCRDAEAEPGLLQCRALLGEGRVARSLCALGPGTLAASSRKGAGAAAPRPVAT